MPASARSPRDSRTPRPQADRHAGPFSQAEPRVARRLDITASALPQGLDAEPRSTPSSTASNASFVEEASALFAALVADPILALSRPASSASLPTPVAGRSSPRDALPTRAASHPSPASRASRADPPSSASGGALASNVNNVSTSRPDSFSRRPPIPPRISSRGSQAQVLLPSHLRSPVWCARAL